MDDNINAEDSAMDALLNGMTNVPDDNDNIIDPPTPPSADNDGEPPKPEPEKSWWSEFGEYENEEAFKSKLRVKNKVYCGKRRKKSSNLQ